MEKEIVISNDLTEVIGITRFVEDLGISLYLPPNVTRNICLAVEEAVTNIIRHAYPDGKTGKISLRASFVNGELTFLIVDDGISFDPTLKSEISSNPSVGQILTGGLSFFLVCRTMDEVTYHTVDSLNYLMLTKRIKATDEPQETMKTNFCKIEDIIILTIEGRLDTVNAREFESTILPMLVNNTKRIVIVNCKWLTYISSSGLRSFILLQKSMSNRNEHLILEAMSPEIRKIFDMTGCSSLFTIL
ncbi:anti-sigma factor antagonist [Parabacteroides sp. AM08-6]|uniref:anti-sigma factor antagonist n=1 Tax=Parabacteroides sp. AM08-6 TaxID=2292053 RepID=UPI000EFF798D|nr:anti-sigma factor antagonist [Parabacteroides sp. AM08-6]RHJ82678.1 STAS domain-containing protein [Parabacteroides sp. AM08-6]